MEAKEKIAAAINVIAQEMMKLNKISPDDPLYSEAVKSQKVNLDRIKKLVENLEKA